MNYYSLYNAAECYQVLSGRPDLTFGFDEDNRLSSVVTTNLMNVELLNARQMDQLTEVVETVKQKYYQSEVTQI